MSALRSLHFRTWYCLCGWRMGHWSAVTGPSGWRVTCQVDGDAAAEGSVRWVWEGTSGTQRCFKLGTVWRATCSFILRYWAHWEVCIRMGVGGSYPDLPFFFLLCSCFPLCSSLSHSGCHWFLSSSVGRILYFELCFRNTWRHVVVEKEWWYDLQLSWSRWWQNTRVCDKEGCIGLDLTQREILLFQGNVLLLSFLAFSLLSFCWIVFLLW